MPDTEARILSNIMRNLEKLPDALAFSLCLLQACRALDAYQAALDQMAEIAASTDNEAVKVAGTMLAEKLEANREAGRELAAAYASLVDVLQDLPNDD